jgi:maleylacetate reductase
MEPFVYQAQPQRVVFGWGMLATVGEELARLKCSRALVLSTAGHLPSATALAKDLRGLCVGVFAEAAMHTPVDITEAALAEAKRLGADALISLGGGSTIGLGKAIALRTDLPQIVIPTTYAGSEATPILGETQDGRKTTQRDPKILPEVVLYDVELTMTLPASLSVTSGLNAIAHAIEASYARERNPIVSLMAIEGVRALTTSLPRIVADPHDREARSDALYGAWACGTCLGAVSMALHHKICHVLGGTFGLPHAETHAVILPHATAYNERAAKDELRPFAELLGAETASAGLHALSASLGAPMSLRDIGMPEDGIERAAGEVVASPYWNPQPLERDGIARLLRQAFAGDRPGA